MCAMTVATGAGTPAHDHGGVTYYFCGEGCRAKFAASPDRYLDARAEGFGPAEVKPLPAGTKYTCPMHPEIVRDGPGICPICGMALEPMGIPHPEAEESGELRDMTRRFWWAAAFTVPILVLAMGDMLPGEPISRLFSPRGRVLAELALATPVCLWAAWPFYDRAVKSVINRSLNMFTLIGLGVSVAYG